MSVLAAGPLWLCVSGWRLAASGRSPHHHILPVAISIILTVCTAGVLAAGGPGGWIGWLLLGVLLLLVSLVTTVGLVVRQRLSSSRAPKS